MGKLSYNHKLRVQKLREHREQGFDGKAITFSYPDKG